jgi:hypothetical protein
MPFHTRLADDDLHDLGFVPKRSATINLWLAETSQQPISQATNLAEGHPSL